MTNEEYIEQHPERFKDDIDKWLFKEFSILGGCCSAEKSHEYFIARMVADKLLELKEEEMQSTIELAEEHAMLAGMNKMEQQMMAKAVDGVCSLELGDLGAVRTTTGFQLNGLHCGDKVKLIIIKED